MINNYHHWGKKVEKEKKTLNMGGKRVAKYMWWDVGKRKQRDEVKNDLIHRK